MASGHVLSGSWYETQSHISYASACHSLMNVDMTRASLDASGAS